MSKRMLLITLTAFAVLGLVGSGQNAVGKNNKSKALGVDSCHETAVHMDTWCPLRVLYNDCKGKPQRDIIRFEETRTYNVSGETMSFECVGGTAPTQTVVAGRGIECAGGAWGANLRCWLGLMKTKTKH